MSADLGNLAGAIAEAGIDADDVVFVAHPETATKLRLQASTAFTATVLGSPQLAVGTVIAVAPGGLMTGYSGEPDVETSTEATIHFEDTNPLPISSGGVLATPTRSAFQQNMIVIRCRLRCAWAALPGAVQVVHSVTW
jgi:hypothetical protein